MDWFLQILFAICHMGNSSHSFCRIFALLFAYGPKTNEGKNVLFLG